MSDNNFDFNSNSNNSNHFTNTNNEFNTNDNSNYNNLNNNENTQTVGPISTLINFLRDSFSPNDSKSNHDISNDSNTISAVKDEPKTIIDRVESILGIDDVDEDDELISKLFNIKPKRLNEIIFLLGGASLVSFAMRTLLFGKTIRAIEIPDGNLTTIVLRSNKVNSLKKTILQFQPPLYPGVHLDINDIKASTFIDPNFTEPILSNRDVKKIQDGGYIVWTKADFEIPRTSVALKALIKDRDLFIRYSNNSELDKIIKLITLFSTSDYTINNSFINNNNNNNKSNNNQNSNSNFSKNDDNNSLWILLKDRVMPWKKKILTDQELLKTDKTEPLSIEARDDLIMQLLLQKGDDIIQLYRKYNTDILLFKYHLNQYYQLKKNPIVNNNSKNRNN